MLLLWPISSVGGMGCESMCRGGEGRLRKAKPFVSSLCFEHLDIPQSGLERGNGAETEVWGLVCCR